MTIITKTDFLNLTVTNSKTTIRECLNRISTEKDNDVKLSITKDVLNTLEQQKPNLTVSAIDVLQKIVDLHNAILTINSFPEYWNNEKQTQQTSVEDFMLP